MLHDVQFELINEAYVVFILMFTYVSLAEVERT